MDCSDLNKFLNNEMTDKEQEIFKEHIQNCKLCKMQVDFYNALKKNNIPSLPENFELSVMNNLPCKTHFYGFVIFALFSSIIGIMAIIATNYFELMEILQNEHYPHIFLQLVDKLNFIINRFIFISEDLSTTITATVPDFLFTGMFIIFLLFMLYNLSLKERF